MVIWGHRPGHAARTGR